MLKHDFSIPFLGVYQTASMTIIASIVSTARFWKRHHICSTSCHADDRVKLYSCWCGAGTTAGGSATSAMGWQHGVGRLGSGSVFLRNFPTGKIDV